MKGLVNFGNSCYLNAALQCMVHIPALTNYILGGWAQKDSFKKRVNACAIANEYAHLVQAYWGSPEPTTLDAKGVWTALCKLHKPFANTHQHDAHEAVTVMLKHLHDALARTSRIRPSVAEERVDIEAWEASVFEDGYSIITELFVGQMQCIVEDGRSFSSTTYEHFQGLTLDIVGCTSVSQAFHKAFAPETVENYVNDGTATTVTLTRHLIYAPIVLILHLKRFDGNGDKVDHFIQYNTTLEIPNQGTYELFAVCFHRGAHYMAACEVNGHWSCMDDHVVTPLNINAIVNKDAYMLMYKKRLTPAARSEK